VTGVPCSRGAPLLFAKAPNSAKVPVSSELSEGTELCQSTGI